MSTISIGHLDGASAPTSGKKDGPILHEKTVAASAAVQHSERAKTIEPPVHKMEKA